MRHTFENIGRGSAWSMVWLALAGSFPLGAQTTAEDLKITIGKSIVIDYPTDVGRISTSNPEIVDAVAVSTREILLHAKGYGVSTVVIWAKTGQRSFYNISVEHNLEPIRKLIKETFPAENIHLQSAKESVSLIGEVSSKDVSDRAAALVASLSKAVVNNLYVTPLPVDKQIMLRVKFAEVNRNAAKQLGVNLFSTGALNTHGSVSTGQFNAPRPSAVGSAENGFSISDALNIFAFRPDLNLGATIKALQSEGVLQILAEPNLITSNGKEASFLVGGEFPVPVLQGGANAGAVTIQFREFGIRLTFNPQMTTHNTLKLHVKPEVSTIDLANAVTLSGFTIPALSTRRMETDIELGPGQSFVIGGLMDDRLTETMSKIPGLSSIPVLGVLFKSKEEKRAKTELIVMVTPEIVDPLNASDPKPSPVMPHEFLPPTAKPASVRKGNPVKQGSKGNTPKETQAAKALAKDLQPVFAPVLLNREPDPDASPATQEVAQTARVEPAVPEEPAVAPQAAEKAASKPVAPAAAAAAPEEPANKPVEPAEAAAVAPEASVADPVKPGAVPEEPAVAPQAEKAASKPVAPAAAAAAPEASVADPVKPEAVPEEPAVAPQKEEKAASKPVEPPAAAAAEAAPEASAADPVKPVEVPKEPAVAPEPAEKSASKPVEPAATETATTPREETRKEQIEPR